MIRVAESSRCLAVRRAALGLTLLFLFWLVAGLVPATAVVRYAWTNDGNHHDPDDIGAAAMAQALMWRAGARRQAVWVEHSSHIGASTTWQHSEMVESAEGNAWRFDVAPSRVFDHQLEALESEVALAAQIDVSTVGRPLVIFQGGPWESMARGFDLADPSRHQWVTIVSHSNWNDNHEHVGSHRTKDEFLGQYAVGGLFNGFHPPTYVKIDDQNGYAFRTTGLSNWSWLLNDPDLAFVYDRTVASGSAQGDFSDAGMIFYWLTGIEHPTMQDIRNFLE